VISLLTVLAALAAVPAAATQRTRNGAFSGAAVDPIVPVNGSWVAFLFRAKGDTTPAFEISSSSTVLLRVTDTNCRGDRLAVIEGSTVIGRTDPVGVDPECDQNPFITQPDSAFDSATYSHGAFLLSPGDHTLRIRVLASPFEGGIAYLSASHCSIVGTDSAEVLRASSGGDFVCAAGGADSIRTRSGGDKVYASFGDDTVRTEAGPDRAEGEEGHDVLSGGTGADRAVGGAGTDAVLGETGGDLVIGGAGIDLLRGMRGNDVLDSVDAVAGNDLVVGGPGTDLCRVDKGDHVRGCEQVKEFAPETSVQAALYASTIARLQAGARRLVG